MCDFIVDCNNNVFPISHHFQDIYCKNEYDLDLDLEHGPRSTVNIPIERIYATTSYLLEIVTFALSATIFEIFTGNVHDLDVDL